VNKTSVPSLEPAAVAPREQAVLALPVIQQSSSRLYIAEHFAHAARQYSQHLEEQCAQWQAQSAFWMRTAEYWQTKYEFVNTAWKELLQSSKRMIADMRAIQEVVHENTYLKTLIKEEETEETETVFDEDIEAELIKEANEAQYE